MQDLSNNIKLMQSLAPAVRDADANGDGVDIQGYENVAIVVDSGVEGITLSGTNKIEFELEHSDDNSSWSDAESADVNGSLGSGGLFLTLDDNAESPQISEIEYLGSKRYVRVVANFSGTHGTGTPCSAFVILGKPRHAPA
jgi:hypothetical protein|tara:strand:+ start:1039 stop:1461 length:423 start_codon:yes stop_codon:yes gene_type:complete